MPYTDLKSSWITVTHDNVEEMELPSLYPYPFTDFPIVTSHVRPHFIVFNCGRQLAEGKGALGPNNAMETLKMVREIYNTWTTVVPTAPWRTNSEPQDGSIKSADDQTDGAAHAGATDTGRLNSVSEESGSEPPSPSASAQTHSRGGGRKGGSNRGSNRGSKSGSQFGSSHNVNSKGADNNIDGAPPPSLIVDSLVSSWLETSEAVSDFGRGWERHNFDDDAIYAADDYEETPRALSTLQTDHRGWPLFVGRRGQMEDHVPKEGAAIAVHMLGIVDGTSIVEKMEGIVAEGGVEDPMDVG